MRFLTLLFACFSLSLSAQYQLEVLDNEGQGLNDVLIFDFTDQASFRTNSVGKLSFSEADLNNVFKRDFSIFKEGYASQTISIDFKLKAQHQIVLLPLNGELNEVLVTREGQSNKLQMRSIEGMNVYESKKSEKIILKNLNANLATNNNRQIYGKVPGINIWESAGSGLSTELGGRGLSPQRSSNFNIRQNGYDISADALGYPDAYYVPPAEALEQIEITRGASSLQYGTQFGGIINYKLKDASDKTPLHVNLRQTVGSYKFSNTHFQLDGTKDKLSYILIGQYKRGDAWRDNSAFFSGFAYTKLSYRPIKQLEINAQYTLYHYLAQQAGGLTDQLFEENDQQSIRQRNFFKINWHLPQLSLQYDISSRLKIQSTSFALIAQRYALGFLGNITRTDPLDERDLLTDYYKNFGNETRLLFKYKTFSNLSSLLIGTRIYKGNTIKQQGLASDSYKPDFEYLNPDKLENSDYTFPSRNIALFAENIFKLSSQWSITPGIRLENIFTSADGYYRETTTDLAGNILLDTTYNEQLERPRTFVIMGIGASYRPRENIEVYSGITQNYRAVNFNDLRIVNVNFQVDPNLQDEKGFNADIGLRGNVGDILAYDISAFYLYYKNRIGFTLEYDSTLFNIYRYRTNVSDSRNIGIESVFDIDYLQLSKHVNKDFSLKHTLNFSYINGQYLGTDESAFEGKQVELVPPMIFRTSLTFSWKDLSLSSQFSYIDQQFTDATNSESSADAVNGIVPAYHVMDLSVKYQFQNFQIEGNINNLLNTKYFTRRAAGYPGPGIIPADRRTFYLTLSYDFNLKKKDR